MTDQNPPVSDPETGTVEFDYHGSRYRMVFDMAAIAFFESPAAADTSFIDAFDEMKAAADGGGSPKLSTLGWVMQAGLRRHHPEVDFDRATRMALDPGVQQALGVAVKAASPDPRKAPPKAKAKRSGSTRSSSKRSKRG